MTKLLPFVLFAIVAKAFAAPQIMTVRGPIDPEDFGKSLIHEHILVDFIGAAGINYDRWDKETVANAMLPYLAEIKNYGIKSFVDCTPVYIGRDPLLLKSLSEQSDLHIVTNTGYYGAGHNRYLPNHAFHETAEQLAARWIAEFENGIEGTDVYPGFIKTGVAPESLSELHQKLIIAAAQTHLATGLTIASHSGPSVPALEQVKLLKNHGVSPSAFIWVHAHNAKDLNTHVQAAREGAWISLDGIREKNADRILTQIENLRSHDLLHKVLLSHDAGWFSPHQTEPTSKIRPYTALFTILLPQLRERGYSQREIDLLLIKNPAEALTIQVRKR